MIGTRDRIAISCARKIFLIVSGHHDPALTVASFATTTTSRPSTKPTVVTTPAAGAVPTSSSFLLPAFCFLVLVIRNQQAYFLSERIPVEQEIDALASCQLALLMLLLDFLQPATETKFRFQPAQRGRQISQARCLR